MTPNGFDVQRIFLDVMNGKSVATLQLLIAQRRNVTDVGRTHSHGPPQLIPPLRPGNHSHTLAHNIKLRHQSSQQPAHTLIRKILKKRQIIRKSSDIYAEPKHVFTLHTFSQSGKQKRDLNVDCF